MSNNTGKYIAGLGTAGAIGAGLLFFSGDGDIDGTVYDEDFPEAVVEVIDDIQPYYIPTDRYAVKTYALEQYRIEVPEIASLSPELVRILALAIDGIAVESLSPELVRVVVEVVNAVAIDSPQVASLSPELLRIIILTVQRLDGDVPKIQALKRLLADTFADQRMIAHDKTLTINNSALQSWLDIYSKPLPPPIAHIPLPRGIRMIAELRSLDHAAGNLAYYRRQGYNAVLVTLDGSETPAHAIALAASVKAAGMAPWLAWAGKESLTDSIYQDPQKIAALLRAAAPRCAGYLPAWRRTSAHLVQQDPHYIEHLAAIVRQANPAILVVGESYYGQTWQNEPHINQRGWKARDNVLRNQSGILIAGIATQGYAVEVMLRGVFARWVATPRLAQVLGETPYYASSNSTGRSFEANLRIKQQLEQRFLRAGCIGTVTIHGDGSDRGSSLMSVDDIGKYRIP